VAALQGWSCVGGAACRLEASSGARGARTRCQGDARGGKTRGMGVHLAGQWVLRYLRVAPAYGRREGERARGAGEMQVRAVL